MALHCAGAPGGSAGLPVPLEADAVGPSGLSDGVNIGNSTRAGRFCA